MFSMICFERDRIINHREIAVNEPTRLQYCSSDPLTYRKEMHVAATPMLRRPPMVGAH